MQPRPDAAHDKGSAVPLTWHGAFCWPVSRVGTMPTRSRGWIRRVETQSPSPRLPLFSSKVDTKQAPYRVDTGVHPTKNAIATMSGWRFCPCLPHAACGPHGLTPPWRPAPFVRGCRRVGTCAHAVSRVDTTRRNAKPISAPTAFFFKSRYNASAVPRGHRCPPYEKRHRDNVGMAFLFLLAACGARAARSYAALASSASVSSVGRRIR